MYQSIYNEVASTEAVLSLLPQGHTEAIRYITKEIGLNRPEWTIPELKSLDDALHLWCKSTTKPVKAQVVRSRGFEWRPTKTDSGSLDDTLSVFNIEYVNELDHKIAKRHFLKH